MKLLVFTDSHEDSLALKELRKKAKEVDIILCGGDFTIFSHELKKNLKKLADLKKPLYLIHGNHEDRREVEEECKKYKNVHFIHKKIIKLNDISIWGYGGGGFAYVDKNFEKFITDNKKELNDTNILVTHQPPYNTSVDVILSGEHAGSKSIKKYLKHFDISISGHLHETFYIQEMVGKTLVMNPGPDGEVIEIKDIEEEKKIKNGSNR